MSYVSVTVVVDGALEEEEEFSDYLEAEEYLAGVEADAAGHGYRTDVYVLGHEHAPTSDGCECAQYAQDHRPAYTWNGDR